MVISLGSRPLSEALYSHVQALSPPDATVDTSRVSGFHISVRFGAYTAFIFPHLMSTLNTIRASFVSSYFPCMGIAVVSVEYIKIPEFSSANAGTASAASITPARGIANTRFFMKSLLIFSSFRCFLGPCFHSTKSLRRTQEICRKNTQGILL